MDHSSTTPSGKMELTTRESTGDKGVNETCREREMKKERNDVCDEKEREKEFSKGRCEKKERKKRARPIGNGWGRSRLGHERGE